MEEVSEDWQAWDAYPKYRWVFNKLEVAEKLGYCCGPAGVGIKKAGYYIIRPIYNIYGMGIGAHKKYLDPKTDHEDMLEHKHVPPGYFWCEWLDGKHFSTDYIKVENKWEPFSQMIGEHIDEKNLVKFKKWEVVDCDYLKLDLPDWVQNIKTNKYINIESKNNKIIEIHLRSGNDNVWDYKSGTKFYPIWKGDNYNDKKHLKFQSNMCSDSFKYSADNHLSDIRLGYYVDEKI